MNVSPSSTRLETSALSVAKSITRVILSAQTGKLCTCQSRQERGRTGESPRGVVLAVVAAFPQQLLTFITHCRAYLSDYECMRLMGAQNSEDLTRSLQVAIMAVLVKPSSGSNEEIPSRELNVVVQQHMSVGDHVQPRSHLDKLLDSMVNDLVTDPLASKPPRG